MYEKNLKRLKLLVLMLTSIYLLILIFPHIKEVFQFIYSIIIPFFYAFLIAYMINPLINKLCKYKIKRNFAIIIVILFILFIFGLIVSSLIPILIVQIKDFVEKIPNFIKDIDNILNNIKDKIQFLNLDLNLGSIGKLVKNNTSEIAEFFKDNLLNLYKKLAIIVFIPILTVYFIIEFDNIRINIKESLKNKKMYNLYKYIHDVDLAFNNYFSGLFIVVLALIVLSSICFMIIGLDYALLFGIIIGISDIIPYLGPYIGGFVVCLYALTVSNKLFIACLIVIIVLQLIENNLLTPFVQSKKNKQKPIVIIFGFIIFGKLFGFLGMILSIPLTSSLILFYKQFLKKEKEISHENQV